MKNLSTVVLVLGITLWFFFGRIISANLPTLGQDVKTWRVYWYYCKKGEKNPTLNKATKYWEPIIKAKRLEIQGKRGHK